MSTYTDTSRAAGAEKTAGDALPLDSGGRLLFVVRILSQRGYQPSELIGVLQDIQAACHYLPEDLLTYVAIALRMKPATVFGVATFYAQFSLEPKGEYVVRICDGTACHVRNSMAVHAAVRKRLKLADGKFTTPDQRFTVEVVRCLGACSIAPVMVINDQVHPKLTPEAASTIVDTLARRDASADVASTSEELKEVQG